MTHDDANGTVAPAMHALEGEPWTVAVPRALTPAQTLVEVLDAVRTRGSGSRLQVAQRTGLGRSVVAQRVQQLIDHGLLSEDGTAASTGGRRPRQLRFEATAGHLLVADVGATSIDVACTDLAGNVRRHHGEAADIAAGPDAILGRVETLFDELERSVGTSAARPWGIGVGLPGPVEFGTGRPVSPPIMPGWDGYPVRERLQQRYGAPAWVDNDVNVMALGEWRHGISQGHGNVVHVKIGTGIGAGLISDGVLHRGSQGSAGDIGHIQVADDANVVCRCGNIGCLEAVAGGAAIARDGERLARDERSRRLAAVLRDTGAVTARDVSEAAAHGDPGAAELVQRAGHLIGGVLAGVVNFFNPSLVVIGGGVAGAGDPLLASVREIVYRRSLPLATRDLAIKRTTLGTRGGVIGAATMVVDELFSLRGLPRWFDRDERSELRGMVSRG